jgi:hypothetical protein
VEAELFVEVAFRVAAIAQRTETEQKIGPTHVLRHFQDAAYGSGHTRPGFSFEVELLSAGVGKSVEPSAAAELRDGPLSLDPSLVLQAMKRRIK